MSDNTNKCELLMQIEALRAQVVALREAIAGVRNAGKSSGFGSATISQIEAERKAWQKMNEVELMTPAQCLAEIKAQAGRDGFIAGIRLRSKGPCNDWQRAAEDYANQLRQADKEQQNES